MSRLICITQVWFFIGLSKNVDEWSLSNEHFTDLGSLLTDDMSGHEKKHVKKKSGKVCVWVINNLNLTSIIKMNHYVIYVLLFRCE